jgi:WD40 repeat protein
VNCVLMWDPCTGESLLRFERPHEPYRGNSPRISIQGKLCLVADERYDENQGDAHVAVFDYETGEGKWTTVRRGVKIEAICLWNAVDSDDIFVAVAETRELTIWDATRDVIAATIKASHGQISDIRCLNHGSSSASLLSFVEGHHGVRFFDCSTWKEWVEGMKYDCGLTVADDSDDDSTSHLHVWEFASSSVLFSVDKQEIPAILCFDWTGNHLFSSDAAIRDSRTGTISRQFSMNDEPNCLEVELACFSEDNSSVIGVTAEMNTIVWDVASGQILQIARSRERAVGLFGCQGTWCMLGYYTDNYYANRAPVVVWDYLSGENVWNKSTSKAFISSACFGKIGGDRPVAVVGDSDYLMVWDIADDIELHRIPCVRGIDHVAFVPVGDSNMIVYSEDKRIHAIECDTWKEVAKVSLSGDCGTIHKVYEKFHQILLL